MLCMRRKFCFINLFYMLVSVKREMNKYDGKGHKYIALYNNWPKMELIDNANRLLNPKATYLISKQHVELVCRWIKTSKLADSYISNISNCVNEDYTNS